MKTIFSPRLVNGPFDDPVLYVRLYEEKRALLFDLGDVSRLSPSEIMPISDVFVSHTHIDHFVGFDHVLRILLGRDKRIRFYGPRGIIGSVRGKLAGYTWNLVDDYRLEIEVTEVSRKTRRTRLFSCCHRFRDEADLGTGPFDGLLLDDDLFFVRAVHLDHRTPCLAFALEEKVHISVNKDRLQKKGLVVGPWLTEMKRLMRMGREEEIIRLVTADGGVVEMTVGRLAREIARIQRGRKIVYVTDVIHNPGNEKRILSLARGADIMYCEAAFMKRDEERAHLKYHLTAAQAGRLAGLAGAGRLEIFHLSPRYQGEEEELRAEAREYFAGYRRSSEDEDG